MLSPSADLKQLRRSEYQRMRVGGNIEYARSLLLGLERNLARIKPADRRHEIQTELAKKRQDLNVLRRRLDDIAADAELKRRLTAAKRESARDISSVEAAEVEDESSEEEDEEDLLGTPEESESPSDAGVDVSTEKMGNDIEQEVKRELPDEEGDKVEPTQTTVPTTTNIPIPTPTPTTTTTSILRNRHHPTPLTAVDTKYIPTPAVESATGKVQGTEQALATHRLEQESLTDSLLTLAAQLKTSTQTFHSTLESEKSILDRAVDGLDRTTSSMASAERRMGMLRRMTEGKGWWGRMMLYAWIFGLWLVALGIVFLGPKIR